MKGFERRKMRMLMIFKSGCKSNILKQVEQLTFATSSLDGQMSLKNIFFPSFPNPIGSVSKSISTCTIVPK